MSELPFDLIDGFSIAMGKIESKSSSLIHVHPHVTQVTYLLYGRINLKMKSESDSTPHEVKLKEYEAAICKPREFFQLINPYDRDAGVLYIVSPAYVFESLNNEVIYDDAIILNDDRSGLENQKYTASEFNDPKYSLSARNASLRRISEKKSTK